MLSFGALTKDTAHTEPRAGWWQQRMRFWGADDPELVRFGLSQVGAIWLSFAGEGWSSILVGSKLWLLRVLRGALEFCVPGPAHRV